MRQEDIAALIYVIEENTEFKTLDEAISHWNKFDLKEWPATEYLDYAKNFSWHVSAACFDALDEKHERCDCGHLKPDHFLPKTKANEGCLSCRACEKFSKHLERDSPETPS